MPDSVEAASPDVLGMTSACVATRGADVEPAPSNAPPSTNSNTAAQLTINKIEGHSQRPVRFVTEGRGASSFRPDRMRSDDAADDAWWASASSRLGLLGRCSFGSKHNSF
jgi:hypothetical protein